MLPEYRPEPVKTGSFRKVIVIMLIATVAAAGFFLLKPKPSTKLADYKLQYKIEEPIATAVKNDTSLIETLKDMSKEAGKQKLSKHIDQLVSDRKEQLEREIAVTISDRVVKNAKLVLNQRLSEYIWKQVSSGKRPKRYVPGAQRPMSTSGNGSTSTPTKPPTRDDGSGGASRGASKPGSAAAPKPITNGIPSAESR